MRRLGRPPAPACLAGFKHGVHNWGDVQPAQKQQIRDALQQMQGPLCAYCEGELTRLGEHIEHLWRKRDWPQRTFDWTNLFASCDRPDTCGHYKDAPHGPAPYLPQDLIDPTAEDPDALLQIRSSGTIEPRTGLTGRDRHRAMETVRVLNLNLDGRHGTRSLCAERRRVLEVYLSTEPDLLSELESWSAADRQTYIQDELAATREQPFSSILRHFLTAP